MLREGEAGGSVRRAEQDEAERRQHLAQEIALDGVVVGNQDGFARAVIAENGRVDRRDARRVGHFRQQDLDPEGTAGADRARDLDVAAHHAREQPADGQPQAGPGLRLRDAERTALERREDAFKVTRLNSRAGVDHLEFGDGASVMNDKLHAATLGEFDGVRQQIDQDLAQTSFVGVYHDGKYRRALENEIDAFGGGLQTEHADELVEKLADANF